jgi:hypothetical protein
MASPSQNSNSQKLENPVAVDKSARVSPADVGLPFWPALEGSQVDHSVAPAAHFIARINHESKSFLRQKLPIFALRARLLPPYSFVSSVIQGLRPAQAYENQFSTYR